MPSAAAKVLEARPVSDVDVRVITLEKAVVLPVQQRLIETLRFEDGGVRTATKVEWGLE